MHIFFSGIGGTAIGPLALIAKQAGYEVSGSDKQDSQYIDYLRHKGVTDIHIGQTTEAIAGVHARHPIDWYVYSSALAKENPHHPELQFIDSHGIRKSKRDELINQIISDKNLEMIAVAGTHGKTTTTAMIVWLFTQLKERISYTLPAKTSFAEMGHYDPKSRFFIYEADEYDRNFLAYHPAISVISGVDWDHPDIYPTREDYYAAFRQFLNQSEFTILWDDDARKLGVASSPKNYIVDRWDHEDAPMFDHIGKVNRANANLAVRVVSDALKLNESTELVKLINKFPGVGRRFEPIAKNIYSDYAHTPDKIRGALQVAHEVVDGFDRNLVVVYEGLHNTRQHFIKKELAHLFDSVDYLYVVPSYHAREDESLEDLTPEKLIKLMSDKVTARPVGLNSSLHSVIAKHAKKGDLVLCLSAGGGGSLDEWIRKQFA